MKKEENLYYRLGIYFIIKTPKNFKWLLLQDDEGKAYRELGVVAQKKDVIILKKGTKEFIQNKEAIEIYDRLLPEHPIFKVNAKYYVLEDKIPFMQFYYVKSSAPVSKELNLKLLYQMYPNFFKKKL